MLLVFQVTGSETPESVRRESDWNKSMLESTSTP